MIKTIKKHVHLQAHFCILVKLLLACFGLYMFVESPMLNLSKDGEQQICQPRQNYKRQILRKITHENPNQYITMCPCIKFQSIWRTLYFGTKYAQNYMNDKISKK